MFVVPKDFYKNGDETIETFFIPGKLYKHAEDKTIYVFLDIEKHQSGEEKYYLGNFLWISKNGQPHIATAIFLTKYGDEYWLLWRRCKDGDEK